MKTRAVTKATKKTKRAFQDGARKILESLGATLAPGEFPLHGWRLETRFGGLGLTIDPGFSGSGPGTVFTRFDDPARARKGVSCNQYTGKWNHHYFTGVTLETALEDLEGQLCSVLPEVPA